MSTQGNVAQAKTRFSQVISQVQSGEDSTVAKAGQPEAQILPIAPKKTRTFGLHPELAVPDEELLAPMSEDELAQWAF